MKCNKENKSDYIKDICDGVENGGEITLEFGTCVLNLFVILPVS